MLCWECGESDDNVHQLAANSSYMLCDTCERIRDARADRETNEFLRDHGEIDDDEMALAEDDPTYVPSVSPPMGLSHQERIEWGHARMRAEGVTPLHEQTPPHEPPPLGPAATPTNLVQPDVDEAGRDHYDEADDKATAKAFPGTFVVRDAVQPGEIEEGEHKGQFIEPRTYPGLLYDGFGMPVMAPQLLTYLSGPEPKPKRVKMLIKALMAFKAEDERGYQMVYARFEHKHSYRRIGDDFGVSKDTARHAVLDFITHVTDWADAHWAAQLEHDAYEAGSLADDEGMVEHYQHEGQALALVPPAKSVAPEDAPFTRPTPIETYWRMWRAKRAREAYERGA